MGLCLYDLRMSGFFYEDLVRSASVTLMTK